jgi:hypothetical protein
MRNLASLSNATDRLTRELRRTGVLADPHDDRVEPTNEEWRVLKDATDTESLSLFMGRVPATRILLDPALGRTKELAHVGQGRTGFTGGFNLRELAARAAAEEQGEDVPPLKYDPEALAFVRGFGCGNG